METKIKKNITMCDEDILNLRNAVETLISNSSMHDDFLLEVLTINSIIKRWENAEVIENNKGSNK